MDALSTAGAAEVLREVCALRSAVNVSTGSAVRGAVATRVMSQRAAASAEAQMRSPEGPARRRSPRASPASQVACMLHADGRGRHAWLGDNCAPAGGEGGGTRRSAGGRPGGARRTLDFSDAAVRAEIGGRASCADDKPQALTQPVRDAFRVIITHEPFVTRYGTM
eukprot:5878471-Pleurochrysis_carterae.AAC.1